MDPQLLGRIKVIVGDITRLPPDLGVDCVVNAANESLLGGSGVDGAIHRAAGPELLEHNRKLDGCPTGLARVTPAFGLTARGVHYIIHAVGPVWNGDEAAKLGDTREDVLLASCYLQSLDLARENDCRGIAFPAISTGVYGFPKQRAARIAFSHVADFLAKNDLPQRVIFCSFSEADAAVYHGVIATRDQWMKSRGR